MIQAIPAIEFQRYRSRVPVAVPDRNVLITHVPPEQGNLWQAILNSQGISANFEANWQILHPNLLELLKDRMNRGETLPDLILMDIGVKDLDSDEFHSGQVCLWCNRNLPNVKVIFLNARTDQISDLEKRWALRRGAIDVLPKLTRKNLLTSTIRITSLLGCSLSALTLKGIAEMMPSPWEPFEAAALMEDPEESTGFVANQADPRFKYQSSAPELSGENLIAASSNNDEYIIYRGVKVRKKKN
jgi:CheY-like chemotaxis protein